MLTKQYISKHQKVTISIALLVEILKAQDIGNSMTAAQSYLSHWFFGGEWMHSLKKLKNWT